MNKPEFGTRNTGMYVPDDFFQKFQTELEKKIDEKAQKRLSIRRWSIAASICLLIGLAPVAWIIFGSEGNTSIVTEGEMYAEAESEDINTDDIMVTAISDYDIYEYFYADL